MRNGGITAAAAIAAAVVGALLVPGASAQAAPGDPSPGYSGGGSLGSSAPTAVLAVPGGDVYVAAEHEFSNRILLMRLTPSGQDTGFGTDVPGRNDGAAISVDMEPSGLARQADGKFVIVGASNQGSALVVLRTLADGTLDPTFDGDGQVAVPAAEGTTFRVGQMTVGPTGPILVGAVGHTAVGDTLAVRALGTAGKPDKTFGTQGRPSRSAALAPLSGARAWWHRSLSRAPARSPQAPVSAGSAPARWPWSD
jgi:hypothetical protein